jgi:hypothetical protein
MERLRAHASFYVPHPCLDSRRPQLEVWLKHHLEEQGRPPDDLLAETLASVAKEIRSDGGDWNVFWSEVARLMPEAQRELARYELLLGMDGALHRATDDMKVFFLPRKGTQDDSDIGDDADATDVPPSLRSSVALLSDKIQTVAEVRNLKVQTPVRSYLGGGGYVSQFRVDTIFSDVLLKAVPKLPASLHGEQAKRCRDVLAWALRLANSLVLRGRRADTALRHLPEIPVPCQGGWYRMADASFGEGRPNSCGDLLASYLRELSPAAAKAARARLLLPPTDDAWLGISPAEVDLLPMGGVFDGLRLMSVHPKSWNSTFRASASSFPLPSQPPAVFSQELWNEWINEATETERKITKTEHEWQVGSMHSFPGMADYFSLSDSAREALSKLILASLPRWESGLKDVYITKESGQWDRLSVTSPLRIFLRARRWLAVHERENRPTVWSNPAGRWLVPADVLVGHARHYAHLRPMPVELARSIGQRQDLLAGLKSLDMPVFDPHSETASPRLLKALTEAVDSGDIVDANVLLGQIREAWRLFRPGESAAALEQLPVRRRDKRLTKVTPSLGERVFVPDTAAYAAELEANDFPVIAMHVRDAKALRDWFADTYGDVVRFTSELTLVPKVSGSPWTGARATPIAESELAWLLRPLFVLAADGRGLHSSRFKECAETLRTCLVDWVPDLSVVMTRDDTEFKTISSAAFWKQGRDTNTLIVTEACKIRLEALSEPLSQMLDRDDLELPLRLLLRGVESIDEAPDDAESFLAPLRLVSPEQIRAVLEHLKGDVGFMAKMAAVFIQVMLPGGDSGDHLRTAAPSMTEEELELVLKRYDIPSLDVPALLRAARDSHDLFEFARAVSLPFGDRASLARWNEVLQKNSQSPLINRQCGLQLQAALEEAASLAKHVIAHAIRLGCRKPYAQMWREYGELAAETTFDKTHWSVEFADAMKLFARLAGTWLIDDRVARSIDAAENLDELRRGLLSSDVKIDADPDERSRANNAIFEFVARELDRLCVVIWARSAPESAQAKVDPFIDRYRSAMETRLAGRVFVDAWSESDVFGFLKVVSRHDMPEFAAAVAASNDLASLREVLNTSPEELANVEAQIQAIEAAWSRQRRLIDVCGKKFDSSEENLTSLWAHLFIQFPDAGFDGIDLNLNKPSSLREFDGRGGRKGASGGPSGAKTVVRPSKAVDHLVGLAGEIFVYRLLQNKYGKDTVSTAAWVSGYSNKVYPGKAVNDLMGCDFAFTFGGTQYRVEVKSSAGDDTSFKLGSSEIRLAMKLGAKVRRRKEVFLIVHVLNALSENPEPVVLRNPYDPRYADDFLIEEADARVRYRRT